MANLNQLATSTFWQTTSGLLVGQFMDTLLGGDTSVNSGNALMQAVTVLGQLLGNALFLYTSMDFARRRNLLSGDASVDSLLSTITLVAAQPRLAQRIMSLGAYVRSLIMNSTMTLSTIAAPADDGHRDNTSPDTIQTANQQSPDFGGEDD